MTRSEMIIAGAVARIAAPDKCTDLFDALSWAYSGRAYHNFDHIAGMLELVQKWQPEVSPPLIWAIIFHDVFYEPGGRFNEEESALMMRRHAPPETQPVVELLILRTKLHDTDLSLAPVSLHGSIAAIIDADLWGFVIDYDGNTAKVRTEFSSVNDADWEAGRVKFLETFADRYPFFVDPEREREFGSKARRNCMEELDRLKPRVTARSKGYEPDPCECGAHTVTRNGASLVCDSCGRRWVK